MNENLEKASANGKIIIDSTRDDDEKQFINKTLDSLQQGLSETKTLIEDKKKQVKIWQCKKFPFVMRNTRIL